MLAGDPRRPVTHEILFLAATGTVVLRSHERQDHGPVNSSDTTLGTPESLLEDGREDILARCQHLPEEFAVEPTPDEDPAETEVVGGVDESPEAEPAPELTEELLDEPEAELNPLADVDFGSDDAAELAIEAGLDASHFEGLTPSGARGFGVTQVREIIEAL